jgi:hypothetical protein
MQNQAEVVRLESQLTVPTRNRSHLSDVWIAISCTESIAEWAAEFSAVVPRQWDPEDAPGTLQVVAMSERKGWLVARGVDLSAHDIADIEDKVRSVVARVNLGVASSPTVDSAPALPLPWSRVGAGMQSGGSSVRRLLSSSRPGPAVDAMSGR